MPRATVNISDTRRFELKSLEGAFVVLRKMNYGQILHRQEMAMKMQMSAAQGQKGNNVQMEMASAHQAVAIFEMQQCIVDHNLEDDNGNPLDFRVGATTTLLDPIVGQEIGLYIDEMNQLNTAELGNSSMGSSDVSATPITTTN